MSVDGVAHSPEGEALLRDVFDLIRRRLLPELACDDPARRRIQALMPDLGEALGRPALMLVKLSQHRRAPGP